VDAISVLKDDHKMVKKMFREFAGTTDRAVKTRERLGRRATSSSSSAGRWAGRSSASGARS
jgi:hypothetical protein